MGVCSYGWYMAAAAWVRRGVPMDLRTLTVMTVIGLPVLALGVLFFLLVRGAGRLRPQGMIVRPALV